MILDTNCEVLKASATNEMKGVVMPYVCLLFIVRFMAQTGLTSEVENADCFVKTVIFNATISRLLSC